MGTRELMVLGCIISMLKRGDHFVGKVCGLELQVVKTCRCSAGDKKFKDIDRIQNPATRSFTFRCTGMV
jgi:hypothetical protein